MIMKSTLQGGALMRTCSSSFFNKSIVTPNNSRCNINRNIKRTLFSVLLPEQQQQKQSFIKIDGNFYRCHHESTNNKQTAKIFSSSFSSSSSTSTKHRPFQILGLQQVAVGSTDPVSMRNLWMDILGLQKVNTHTSEKENVMEDICIIGPPPESSGNSIISSSSSSISDSGNIPIELDLMCPIDENKSPKVHKPPLNHIGLWVDNLPLAVEWMKSKGVRFAPGGIRKGAAGYDVTFIHPKGNTESPIGGCGVLIELVQAPTSVIKALKRK